MTSPSSTVTTTNQSQRRSYNVRSTSKKMVFTADECEVTFFSTDSYETNW